MSEQQERKRVSGRKRAEEHKGGFDSKSIKLGEGVQLFALEKAGVYRIDIVPYRVPANAGNPYAEPGDLHFERTYFTHRGVGANQDTYICPRKTAQKPCPICEIRAKMAKDPDANEDMIKEMAPKERQLWNVFDHDDPDKGVQVWDISYHLFGKQLDARIKNADEDEGYDYFADPVDGKTLKIGFTEKSFGKNDYYEAESIDFKSRAEPLSRELGKKAQILDNLLIIPEYEDLKKIFLEAEDTAGKKDGDEDPPAKRDRASGKKEEKKEEKKLITAESLGIEKGDEVEYDKKTCSVIKISPDGTSLTLMDSNDDIIKAVSPAEVKTGKATGNGEAKTESKKEDKKETAGAAKGDGKKDDAWDENW